MICSLIQFQSFCNPYNCSCYSACRNLRLLRTFKKIKLKIKWPCRRQISRQVVVSVILVHRWKEIELSHPLVRPLKLTWRGRPKAGSWSKPNSSAVVVYVNMRKRDIAFYRSSPSLMTLAHMFIGVFLEKPPVCTIIPESGRWAG